LREKKEVGERKARGNGRERVTDTSSSQVKSFYRSNAQSTRLSCVHTAPIPFRMDIRLLATIATFRNWRMSVNTMIFPFQTFQIKYWFREVLVRFRITYLIWNQNFCARSFSWSWIKLKCMLMKNWEKKYRTKNESDKIIAMHVILFSWFNAMSQRERNFWIGVRKGGR